MTRRHQLFAALLTIATLQMTAPAQADTVSTPTMSAAMCEAGANGLSAGACGTAATVDAGALSPEPDPSVLLLAAAAVVALRLARGRRGDAA